MQIQILNERTSMRSNQEESLKGTRLERETILYFVTPDCFIIMVLVIMIIMIMMVVMTMILMAMKMMTMMVKVMNMTTVMVILVDWN